jgi:hypothetical protein
MAMMAMMATVSRSEGTRSPWPTTLGTPRITADVSVGSWGMADESLQLQDRPCATPQPREALAGCSRAFDHVRVILGRFVVAG